MKKIIVFVAFATALGSTAFAQTKKIAHRSHSGKNSVFTVEGEGNFGLPTDYKAKSTKDSAAKKTTPAKTDSTVKPGDTKKKTPVKSDSAAKKVNTTQLKKKKATN